jgi:hypothetical protein
MWEVIRVWSSRGRERKVAGGRGTCGTAPGVDEPEVLVGVDGEIRPASEKTGDVPQYSGET